MKRLDYESLNIKFLTFGVVAIGSQATATASVTIQVTDINDNAPVFLANVSTLRIIILVAYLPLSLTIYFLSPHK